MRTRTLLTGGLVGQAGLLATLARAAGLGPAGWAAGAVGSLAVGIGTARGLRHDGGHDPGPADVVTFTRAGMCCAVAGLAIDRFARPPAATIPTAMRAGAARTALALLSAGALALDAVDGQVARRTGTASAFGARFDGEVDALLILALGAHAARPFGGWVLAGGVARYAFGAAGLVLPWMRRPLPFRYWRKVATATEGIALAAAASGLLPRRYATAGLLAGSLLIGESFGRDVWWLWRRRGWPL